MPEYGAVGPPWWTEVWIVACGPSAASFDFSRMRGTALLINDVALLSSSAPDLFSGLCSAVFSADPRWVSRQRQFLKSHEGEKFACVALDTHPECAGISGVTYLQRAYFEGLSEDPGFLTLGGNSGHAAISLAVHKKAREIHLVGFDMDPMDGEKYAQWAPRFRTMLPQLHKLDIKVINHSLHSFVDAFRKEP